MFAHDGVRAGGVDDADFAQQFDRRGDQGQVLFNRGALFFITVAQQVDLRSRRGDAFLEQFAAQQRVDERTLARVKLADYDQQKELIDLQDRTERLAGLLR